MQIVKSYRNFSTSSAFWKPPRCRETCALQKGRNEWQRVENTGINYTKWTRLTECAAADVPELQCLGCKTPKLIGSILCRASVCIRRWEWRFQTNRKKSSSIVAVSTKGVLVLSLHFGLCLFSATYDEPCWPLEETYVDLWKIVGLKHLIEIQLHTVNLVLLMMYSWVNLEVQYIHVQST